MVKKLTVAEYRGLCRRFEAICERIGACSNNCPAEYEDGTCAMSRARGLLLRYAVKEG